MERMQDPGISTRQWSLSGRLSFRLRTVPTVVTVGAIYKFIEVTTVSPYKGITVMSPMIPWWSEPFENGYLDKNLDLTPRALEFLCTALREIASIQHYITDHPGKVRLLYAAAVICNTGWKPDYASRRFTIKESAEMFERFGDGLDFRPGELGWSMDLIRSLDNLHTHHPELFNEGRV